jgi:hypothetical protein
METEITMNPPMNPTMNPTMNPSMNTPILTLHTVAQRNLRFNFCFEKFLIKNLMNKCKCFSLQKNISRLAGIKPAIS